MKITKVTKTYTEIVVSCVASILKMKDAVILENVRLANIVINPNRTGCSWNEW